MASIANMISEFTDNFQDFFNTNVLSLLSEQVGGYYALFGTALLIYLIYQGARIALGLAQGKEFQDIIKRAVFALLFLTFGYALLPTMDYFGEVAIEYLLPDGASMAMQDAINTSDALTEVQESEYLLTDADVKNVAEAQAKISTGDHADAQIDNANEYSQERKSDSIWGMIKSGLASVVAQLMLIIGAICKMIITFFILIIKGLLRITFPIAVSLSLIFKAEKALETWWESYITVIMMGVIIAAISTMQNLMVTEMTTRSLDAAQIGIAAMSFAFGVAYLCTPTLTVLCFGGSQAASQLPQQISMAMMGAAGMSMTVLKSPYTSAKAFNNAHPNLLSRLFSSSSSDSNTPTPRSF